MKIVGRTINDVNKTPIDFFSIGHIISGIIVYFVGVSIVNFINPDWNIYEISFIITFILSWSWELIENSLLSETRFKFLGKVDSVLNSLMDQFFVMMGAVIGFFVFMIKNVILMVTITIIIVVILYVFYCYSRRRTLSR